MTPTDALHLAAHDQAETCAARARRTHGDSSEGTVADVQRRLGTYSTRIGNHYRCPCCWVREDETNVLRAIPGTEREDKLKCHACGSVFTIPLGD